MFKLKRKSMEDDIHRRKPQKMDLFIYNLPSKYKFRSCN